MSLAYLIISQAQCALCTTCKTITERESIMSTKHDGRCAVVLLRVSAGILAGAGTVQAGTFSFTDNYSTAPSVSGYVTELTMDDGAVSAALGYATVGGATGTLAVGDFSPWGLNAFGADPSGDHSSLVASASTPWGSIGHITYHFTAGADQAFSGAVTVDAWLGVVVAYGGWAGAVVQSSLNGSDWTTIASVSASAGPDVFGQIYNTPVTVNADGSPDLYLRIYLANSYYSYASQLSYLSVTGTTAAIPEAGALGLLATGIFMGVLKRR